MRFTNLFSMLAVLLTVMGVTFSPITQQSVAACGEDQSQVVQVDPCAAYPTTEEPGIVDMISPDTLGFTIHDFKQNIRSRLMVPEDGYMVFDAAPEWYFVTFIYTGPQADCPQFDMSYPISVTDPQTGADVTYYVRYTVVHDFGDKEDREFSTTEGLQPTKVCELTARLQ